MIVKNIHIKGLMKPKIFFLVVTRLLRGTLNSPATIFLKLFNLMILGVALQLLERVIDTNVLYGYTQNLNLQ